MVVVASGPSLDKADASRLSRARLAKADLRILAVNDAWRMVPCADALYACDAKWWEHHAASVAAGFEGERWTQDQARGLEVAGRLGLNVVKSRRGGIPSDEPDVIAQGMNSGFQAVNLAALAGGDPIVLLGFDMGLGPGGLSHFFGDHPTQRLNVKSPFADFIRHFETSAPYYARRGVKILNASRRSALTCFPRIDLEEALNALPDRHS